MATKYDENVDYQALINKAVAEGDYVTAAQAEQQRNAKINDLGLGYETTSKYTGWLDSTDYGTVGKQQMAAGADWRDVLDTYESRYNKAATTEGLTQYANDDVQKEMWDYITANMNKPAVPTFDYGYYDSSKPTFESNYSARIDEMLNQILNREDFSYNAENDQLFQQYKTQYNREGNRSMNDTLAAAASQAGGMNSYAMTAAQQANDYYAAQLGDKIPELYQLAYEMYLNDIDQQVRDLGLLQDMDNTQYSRYRDTMSDWRDDRDFAYGAYRDDVGDYKWQTEFDYGASRDKVADSQWQQSFDHGVLQDDIYNKFRQEQADISNDQWQQGFDYDKDRDGVADDRYDSETAYGRAMELLSVGAMPDDAMLQQAGLTRAQAQAILAGQIVETGGGGGGGGGGNGGGSGGGGTTHRNETTGKDGDDIKGSYSGYDNGGLSTSQVKELQKALGVTADGLYGSASKKAAGGLSAEAAYEKFVGGGDPWGAVNNLGIGPVNASLVTEIANYGGITENDDGSLRWTNGWSAGNYQEKLSAARANSLYSYLNHSLN